MPRTEMEVLISVDHDAGITEEALNQGVRSALEGTTVVRELVAGESAVIDEVVINSYERREAP